MQTSVFYPWEVVTASLALVGDTDAIKTSIATAVTTQTYTSFNGVSGGGPYVLLRNVTVTTSTHTGTYNTTAPIVFTGTDLYGNVVTDSLTLTAANGNETIVGTVAFKSITQIDVPVQVDNLGTFQFGLQDAFISNVCVGMRVGTAGNVKVTYSNGTVDTVPFGTAEFQSISPVKIWGTSATTASSLVVYLRK